MKICPVAIAVGCAKCPVFKVCPLIRSKHPRRGAFQGRQGRQAFRVAQEVTAENS
jgi:hypothetical protein